MPPGERAAAARNRADRLMSRMTMLWDHTGSRPQGNTCAPQRTQGCEEMAQGALGYPSTAARSRYHTSSPSLAGLMPTMGCT